jgi:predicted DNA-binding transcriptional regulator AlpA
MERPMFVRPADVSRVTGGLLSRTRAYQLENDDPDFPRRIRLAPRATGWDYQALNDYLQRKGESENV